MFRTLKYTLILAVVMGGLNACNDSGNTKSLDQVDQTQEADPSVIRNNESASGETVTNPEPEFQFNTTEWDFGTITEGMRPTFVFKYKNVGNANLVISGCEASCGCTTPKWTKEPVPPGGTGEIHVAFNSSGKNGTQHKTVTVTANTNPPKTVLKVTGNIVKK